MHYVMPLKCWEKKEWLIYSSFRVLFANPVSFNTIYHTLNNVAPYMFNSFSIERNILKNINLQNNGVRLQYGGCHHKS